MDYNKRIGDDFLRGDHLDGEVLQHTELNELENVAKTAINANYEDIQKLQNGVITVGNSEMIDGATLSSFEEETLQNSDTKVPTSAQVKNYVDAQDNTKQDILVSGTNIKTINDTSLLGSGNISITVPTKTSDLTNDSNFVSNTNYAIASKGGVIKSGYNGLQVDSSNGQTYCDTYTYSTYSGIDNKRFISKGTLENVITGKGLVSNTDYATSSTGGVVKVNSTYGATLINNNIAGANSTYATYQDAGNNYLISKGTLENVITGKGLINSSYHDSTKQDTLVSGTNIKTVNNQSLLGSGNINIQGGGDATDVQINGVSITSDGVANINYANTSTGGVFKTHSNFATSISDGYLYGTTKSYADYGSGQNGMFISKGTLENVLNARIGLIDDYLDELNGEVI